MNDLKKKIQAIVDIYMSGDSFKAEALCKDIMLKEPKIVFLYNLLGLIYVSQKKIPLAIESYEKGLEIDPKNPLIYNNLGLLFSHDLPDNKKAEEYFKKSILLNPNMPEAYNNLGSLYKSIDKFDEAIKYFNKSIEVNKEFFQAYHNLGTIYKSTGEFNKAKNNLKKAIGINPKHTNSHRTLSGLIKYSEDEVHLNQLENLFLEVKDSDIENKTNIAFSLGKAYEDMKDYSKSFNYYSQGNDLYKKLTNYSISEDKNFFKDIKNTFNNELFSKFKNNGSNDDSVIFILGMPRSGSTLIEQILSNHEKVFGCGELDLISKIIFKRFGNNDLNLFFENVVSFNKNEFLNLGEEYIKKIKIISKNSIKATDKLPINFFWIGMIKLILPNSKIVHCYRDPKDNCFSIYKNHFPKGKINYSYDLKNIVEYYNLYNDLMKHWNNFFSDSIFNIKYEDLINKTEENVRDMLNFCNLKWDTKCLNFHNNTRIIKTASDVQVRNKIYSSSVGIWKNYKNNLEIYFNKLNN